MERSSREPNINLVGVSKAMQNVLDLMSVASSTNIPILITGESGSGRKTIARSLHERSHRSNRAFVVVQCTEAFEELIESEIFGYEFNSFGKSRQPRIGSFELAGGGSLLFDSIEGLSPSMQLRVLGVLEEKKIRPLGSRSELPVDVRVLATLERTSESMCAIGNLRPELFTFFQAFPIHIPPLRNRKEDLPGLIQSILRDINSRNGKHVTGVSAEVSDLFLSHIWPGNIRELQSVLEHAVILCEDELIRRKHLPINFGKLPLPILSNEPAMCFPLGATMENMERALILQKLGETNGNKTNAAELLGISLKTLHNKLHVYGSRERTGGAAEEVSFPLGMTVENMERELITQTLKRAQNNKTRAADLLGISLKTLHNKLKLYSAGKPK
jgi:DNA-binding NtrC family response regulator